MACEIVMTLRLQIYLIGQMVVPCTGWNRNIGGMEYIWTGIETMKSAGIASSGCF